LPHPKVGLGVAFVEDLNVSPAAESFKDGFWVGPVVSLPQGFEDGFCVGPVVSLPEGFTDGFCVGPVVSLPFDWSGTSFGYAWYENE